MGSRQTLKNCFPEVLQEPMNMSILSLNSAAAARGNEVVSSASVRIPLSLYPTGSLRMQLWEP